MKERWRTGFGDNNKLDIMDSGLYETTRDTLYSIAWLDLTLALNLTGVWYGWHELVCQQRIS